MEKNESIEPMLMGVAEPLEKDTFIYRIIVIALSLTLVGSLVAMTTLALKGIGIPGEIIAVGSGALGALAGLLVNK